MTTPGSSANAARPSGLRTSALLSRDQHVVWHPFTQHSLWPADEPPVIVAGDGMHLVDADGRRYLDGNASLWVNVHGHRVPEIDEALIDQIGRLAHSSFLGATHEPGIVLAEQLVARTPAPLTRAFFSSDGASSVEAALKMAYQAAAQRGESRPLYVHAAEGYHGDTLGAVSVGGIGQFHAAYGPILLQTLAVGSPGILAPGQSRAARASEVVGELASLLAERGTEVCAVIVEPLVQAAAGILTHDPSFLQGVRRLCNEHGVAMIVDEVATGVGRTGAMWAIEHAGVVPDLLTLGKGITGGYLPLSAVMATEEIYSAFLGSAASSRTFFHGHSYTANPLACAAASATLELMDRNGTVAHADRVGRRIGQRLAQLDGDDRIVEVRRLGTMTGIEVRAVPGIERTGFEVCRAMRRRGVLTRPLGDVVVLMPPLAIGDADLDHLLDACLESIDEVVR